MDEEEKECFTELISSVRDLKEIIANKKNETIEDLKFFKALPISKKLGKSEEDTRKLMRSPDFPAVPDKHGDLKVEEQAFIRWCRAENIKIKEEKVD